MQDNLAGLVGFGLPFRDPSVVLGRGADRTAKRIDDTLSAIQYAKVPGTNFSPVNDMIVRPFNAMVGEARTKIGQAANRTLFENRGSKQWEARHRVAQFMTKLEDLNLTEEQYGDVLRQAFEIPGATKNLPPELQSMVKEMRKDLRRMPDEAAEYGIQLKNYIDPQAKYFPRYLTQSLHGKNSGGVPRVMSTLDPSQSERLEFLHGIKGGTVTSKNVFMDKDLNDLVDAGMDTGSIATHMKKLYGNNASELYVSPDIIPEIKKLVRATVPDLKLRKLLIDSMQDKTADQIYRMARNNLPAAGAQLDRLGNKFIKNRFNEMAKWFKGLSKETRDTAVFGNHPLADLQARLLSYNDSIEAAKVFTDTLAARGVTVAIDDKGVGPTIREMLTTAKLQSGTIRRGALKQIARKMGHDVDNMAPDKLQDVMNEIGRLRVRQDIADDMVRMQKGFSEPDSVSPLIEVVQNITNFYKSNLTSPFPAFHVRNLFSGQFQNWVRGMWDPQSAYDSHTFLRGGVISGAKDIPILQRIWRQRQAQYGAGPGAAGAGGAGGAAGGGGGAAGPGAGPSGGGGGVSPSVLPTSTPSGMQSPNPSGFFLRSQRVLNSVNQNVATADQWRAMLRKGGVKAEEFDDLEIEQFLQANPKATKQQLQEHIEANTPQIEIIPGKGEYAKYQIPGGDPGTYREILIRKPLAGDGKSLQDELNALEKIERDFTPAEYERYRELTVGRQNDSFYGPHFDESNVLAHLRVDDVTLPNGRKSLRVQEVQSDWHQKARSEGYRPKSTQGAVATEVPGSRSGTAGVGAGEHATYDVIFPGGINERVRASSPEKAIAIAYKAPRGWQKIPDAPFKKSWHMLGLKQILKQAAEEGYDEVSIVRGRDIAKTVGGPEDSLDKFYADIVSGDLKKYTKRWGSFQGDSQFPGAAKVRHREFVPRGERQVWLNTDDEFAGIDAGYYKEGSGWVATIREPWSAKTPWRQTFASKAEADRAIKEKLEAEYRDQYYYPEMTGDVKVFKITPEMRRDLLDEGQPMYSPAPTPSAAMPPAKSGAAGKYRQ